MTLIGHTDEEEMRKFLSRCQGVVLWLFETKVKSVSDSCWSYSRIILIITYI